MKKRETIVWKHIKVLLLDMLAVLLFTFALVYFPYLARMKKFILSFLINLSSLPFNIILFILFFLSALFIFNFKLFKSLIKDYLYGVVLWVLAISCFLLFSPILPWTTREQIFQFTLCFLSIELLLIRFRQTQFRREELKSENIGLDDPLADPEDDKLNHSAFTKNIFEVIRTLPENNARIAITGEWGSGKSTCLNFIESYAKQDNFPIVRFNPWKFTNKEELWKGFVAAIDKGMGGWKGVSYGPFSQNRIIFYLLSLVRKNLTFYEMGRLFDDLFLSRLQPSFDITKENVSLTLLDMLKGKKLIVFIDDLDRATEDIVYQTLLLIKEIIDVRGCVFICGIDFEALQVKLKHFNIENGLLFSEKIFQFIWEVPIPVVGYKKDLVDTLLRRLRPSIKENLIAKNIELLPDNPRKLKAYFRFLSALQSVLLQRFGDEDLYWEFLYLAELLKLKYPERINLVFQDESFYEYMQMSPFYKGEQQDNKRVKELQLWNEKIKKAFPNELITNEDFEKIVKMLSEVGFGLGIEKIKSYFSILTHVDHLTWKEYREWKKDTKETLLRRLISDKLPYLQRKEFLLALMRNREQLLAQASDEWNHDKVEKMLEEAISITNDCLWYIKQDVIKNVKPSLLDASLCGEWFSLLRNWANFNSKFYSTIRAAEKELAITLAKETINLASEILAKRELLREHDFLEHEKAFKETMETVKDIYTSALSKKLIEDFEKEDSIKALWGKEHYWPEKNLLFKLNNYFYSTENKTKLHDLAKKAETSRIIQGNFHEFLRMLFYAAIDPMSSFDKDSALQIIRDDELRELFWAGSTCKRIQRRSMGDFLNSRKEISKILNTSDIFPIPEWVKEEEPDLLEIYKISIS